MLPVGFVYATSTSYSVYLPLAAAFTGIFITVIIARILGGDIHVPVTDLTKHHNWKSAKILSKTLYCSVCESMLLNGFGWYCDCCNVCADQDCIKKCDKRLACKTNEIIADKMEHHWVKGNLPLGATCHICEDDCSMEQGLVDFQCCWCHRCIHTSCLPDARKYCDLGPFKRLIVPPWCIQVARRKSSVRRHLLVNSVRDPGWETWTPLIVVGNRKSGNGDGELILSEFRHRLHPAQVLDLSERTPEAALKWCVMVAPRMCKILACGGDGTVAWINNTIHKMQLDPPPAVGIIPLGTGNDLSRVLGWGSQTHCEADITHILECVKKADIKDLDRWKVDVTTYRKYGLRKTSKMIYMYNYFSIGVDAQVALDFHRTRESKLYLCKNRFFNKLLYLCFGTHQIMVADYRNLEDRLELYLDDIKVDLPEIQALVVCNIPSWGAGVNLWELQDGSKAKQRYNDGKLEILGISSSFQMAQFQVGLSKPYCIGQASKIEIKLLDKAALQIDGEPWLQTPANIKITNTSSATVLYNKEKFD